MNTCTRVIETGWLPAGKLSFAVFLSTLPLILIADWYGDTLTYVRHGEISSWRPWHRLNVAVLILCLLDIACVIATFAAAASYVLRAGELEVRTMAAFAVGIVAIVIVRAAAGGIAIFLHTRIQGEIIVGD